MSCALVLHRVPICDGCELSWARVRRVRLGSISSELLMCSGCVRSIYILHLVARCLATIDVCIWRMLVCMSVVVTVWGYVGMFVV